VSDCGQWAASRTKGTWKANSQRRAEPSYVDGPDWQASFC
jgi:hypothetical protein